jgi:hypothetical protein
MELALVKPKQLYWPTRVLMTLLSIEKIKLYIILHFDKLDRIQRFSDVMS